MLFQHIDEIERPTLEDDAALIAQWRERPPMNLPRLRQMMERDGLDGLVLGDPVNVFHATGHWPFIGRSRPGWPPGMFVVINRNPDMPPALVAAKFYYYYTVTDATFSSGRPVYIYGEPETLESRFFPDRGEAGITPLEARRGEDLEISLAERAMVMDMRAAIAAALKDYGLSKGVIGYDNALIPGWMANNPPGVSWRNGDDAIKYARIVKSPLEIALMRRASAVNIGAAHAMMKSLRAGLAYRDIRREFFSQAAALGGEGVSLSVDRVSNELSPHTLVEGHALMIDAVSQTNHYFGDYGRTVFLGEPRDPLKRAVEAMQVGWDAVRESLRPGLRFSEVGSIGRDAARKAGYSHAIAFSPHCVGLTHTDEPIRWVDGLPLKADLVLEEGMIISVDCPVVETGYGGSAHLEDLTLITSNGSEPIHSVAATGIIV